jgi:hypothetical protein
VDKLLIDVKIKAVGWLFQLFGLNLQPHEYDVNKNRYEKILVDGNPIGIVTW